MVSLVLITNPTLFWNTCSRNWTEPGRKTSPGDRFGSKSAGWLENLVDAYGSYASSSLQRLSANVSQEVKELKVDLEHFMPRPQLRCAECGSIRVALYCDTCGAPLCRYCAEEHWHFEDARNGSSNDLFNGGNRFPQDHLEDLKKMAPWKKNISSLSTTE